VLLPGAQPVTSKASAAAGSHLADRYALLIFASRRSCRRFGAPPRRSFIDPAGRSPQILLFGTSPCSAGAALKKARS
jgi:hypothetical protein